MTINGEVTGMGVTYTNVLTQHTACLLIADLTCLMVSLLLELLRLSKDF